MSRRNSTSGNATPIKTPAKRAIGVSSVITENTEVSTPARRSTRRRSVSANENEEGPQLCLKAPSFPALSEEDLITKTNSSTAKNMSPQLESPKLIKTTSQTNCTNKVENVSMGENVSISNSSKRRKPGPKCKTRKGNDADDASDVEISVLGEGIDEIKSKSPNVITIVLTDDDSNQKKNAKKESVEEQENNSTVNISSTAENINTQESKVFVFTQRENTCENVEEISNNNESDKQNVNKTKSQRKHFHNASTLVEGDTAEEIIFSGNDSRQETENHNHEIGRKKTDKSMMDISEQNFVVLNPDVEKEKREKVTNISANDVHVKHLIENNTTEKIKVSGNKIDILHVCTLETYKDIDKTPRSLDYKTSSKMVDFTLSPDVDTSNKSIYPKTPIPAKARNSADKNNSFGISQEAPDDELCQVNEINNAVMDISEAKTTPQRSNNYVQNLQLVQSSTPLNAETLNYISLPEIGEAVVKHCEVQNDESLNTQIEKRSPEYTAKQTNSGKDETEMKWINPSVKGASIEGCKLDVMNFNGRESVIPETSHIENEYSNNKKNENNEDEELLCINDEYESENDSINDEDAEQIADDKEREEEHNELIDDEAMAIDDYESGDSMEYEERQEIIDNEIPAGGFSIGSHTTDDESEECFEEENSENDSFIVSDNDIQFVESRDEDKQTDDDGHNKKKKMYKRLQCPTESSSSDEEVKNYNLEGKETVDKNIESTKNVQSPNDSVVKYDFYKRSEKSPKCSNNANNKEIIEENQIENNFECSTHTNPILDNSKLSDSALRLHCSAESDTEEEKEDAKESREVILHKLNRSDRFNKSVRNLNIDTETSPVEEMQTSPMLDCLETSNTDEIKIIRKNSVTNTNSENDVPKELNNCDEKEGDCIEKALLNTESDNHKENEHEKEVISSLGSSENSNRKLSNEYSFADDMTLKCGGLDTKSAAITSKDMTISISYSSSTGDQSTQTTEKQDVKYLENMCNVQLPLGNPLIRTRRQSLALPANPDMEIGSSFYGSKPNTKAKRKSLEFLPNSDFNPSQSLIDTIELHKNYDNRQIMKRKRKSKSFCGASETLDNTVTDIDVQHLNKRFKTITDKTIDGSSDNTSANEKANQLPPKVSPASCQTVNKNKSKLDIQTILNRCDEILEAANQAKLESKTNSKKV